MRWLLGHPSVIDVPKDWIDFRLKALGEDWSTPGHAAPLFADVHVIAHCGDAGELRAGNSVAVRLPDASRLEFKCRLRIYNANAIPLRGAVFQMWSPHSATTFSASPTLAQISLDSSFGTSLGYQLAIDRTLVANNDFFMIDLKGTEPSAKSYYIKFRIMTEDGRILDFGSITVIPSHESG